ncbi:MAG: YncE family protein [Gemmatimonadetes bacterium]|nr:YncE family protein [Gemmatimonadota bacterium]
MRRLTKQSVVFRLLQLSFVVTTAMLPSQPDRLAAQSRTGTLVVTNKGANTASVIDIGSQRIVATIPTGNGPHEVAISHDGRWAVTTNYGTQEAGNSLTLIDVQRASGIGTIDLGRYTRPHGAVFLPGDSLLAVTSEATQSLVLVRLPFGEIARTIATEQDVSHMVTAVTDGGRAWTSNIRSGTISELDIFSGTLVRIITVPPQPEAIQITPDGSEVWVGSNQLGTVSVINATSGSIEATFEGFSFPYRIAFTEDGSTAVVPDLRKNEIRIFDRATREELATIRTVGGGPEGVTIVGNRFAYISLSQRNEVAIIDLESHSVVGTLPTGNRPDGIGYSPLLTSAEP